MYDFLDWVIYECLVSDLTFRMWGLNADICNVEKSLLQGYTGIWHATGHNARFLFGDIMAFHPQFYPSTFWLLVWHSMRMYLCPFLQQFAGILSGIRSGVRVLCGILWRIRRDSCGSKILIIIYNMMLVIAGPSHCRWNFWHALFFRKQIRF